MNFSVLLSDMKKTFNTSAAQLGFSLAEVLAALTIAAMVLVAVLGIYSRAESSTAAITRKLDNSRLPCEVLQRIAEDLDGIIAADKDMKIIIRNKFDNLYPTARLEIVKTIYDKKNEPRTFEKIIWQSSYDYDSDAGGLALYRSHSGIALEDKLLDEQRERWEQDYPFVPICTGVTFFKIQVPKGEDFRDSWTSGSLPKAIVVTISFAKPFKALAGTLDVPDSEKITRTIAIDRTRKIRFVIVKIEYDDKSKGTDEKEGAEKETKDNEK